MVRHSAPTCSVPMGQVLAKALKKSTAKARGRDEDNRLEPECWPMIRPTFQFSKSDQFFAIGSCFARNLENHLLDSGYQIGGSDIFDRLGVSERQRWNRYTPATIYHDLAWAHDIFTRDDTPTEADIAPLLIEGKPGSWLDLYCRQSYNAGVDYETALRHRRDIYHSFRHAFTADVVVITLGMIETWWDKATQSYVEWTPALSRYKDQDRFSFCRLNYSQCHDYVTRCLELLEQQDKPCRILLTTSPVHLARTFTEDDVIVANMYSKSVLRAVAGHVAESHDCVDYFPSFENVILSKTPSVWEDDLIHPTPAFVRRIMQRVMDYYDADLACVADEDAEVVSQGLLLQALWQSSDSKDQARGINVYNAVGPALLATDNPRIHLAAAYWASQDGQTDAAIAHLQRIDPIRTRAFHTEPELLFRFHLLAQTLDQTAISSAALSAYMTVNADHPKNHVRCLRNLAQNQNVAGARELCGLLLAQDITDSDLLQRVATFLFDQGDAELALRACDKGLKADPNDLELLVRKSGILMRTERAAEAAHVYDALTALQPDVADHYLRAIRAWRKAQMFDHASARCEAMITRFPDDPGGYALLARLMWRAKDRDRARCLAQKALLLSADTPWIIREVGTIAQSSS